MCLLAFESICHQYVVLKVLQLLIESYTIIEKLLKVFCMRQYSLVFHFFNDCFDECCLDPTRPLQMLYHRCSSLKNCLLRTKLELLYALDKFDTFFDILNLFSIVFIIDIATIYEAKI